MKAKEILFVLLSFIHFMSCDNDPFILKEQPNIDEIIIHSSEYAGHVVIVDGYFGGWQIYSICNTDEIRPRTRSDILIYDSTGCIYLTGDYEVLQNENELNPMNGECYGAKLKVKALVSIIEEKPILGIF